MKKIKPPTHLCQSPGRSSRTFLKKKEREGTLVTFPTKKKKGNSQKKINPPTHIAISKSSSKFNVSKKKKKERGC
jgi:hypothetical protein